VKELPLNETVGWMLVKSYKPIGKEAANPVGNLIAAFTKDN
jgi:hypothetical protein